MKLKFKDKKISIAVTVIVLLAVLGYSLYINLSTKKQSVDIGDIPAFSDAAYVEIDGNTPHFSESELKTKSYEKYSKLDSLGRCGAACASIGKDIMPTQERGAIGQVKPSGWQTVKYDFVDGKYLYNRCHLIGFQLTGENANERNLITGTRYMNVEGMLPFENMVADYVKETGNHVAYRATPIYEGDNLVASGVQLEALSIEDDGEGICFNVYCYNVQPGVKIDYRDGKSKASAKDYGKKESFVLNTNSGKFHKSDCSGAKSIKEENRQKITEAYDFMIISGYDPASCCFK